MSSRTPHDSPDQGGNRRLQTDRPAGPGTPALLAVLALLLCCAALALHVWHFDYTVDDAYITFRYARNLATGYGPVFNPGEKVEGYTNPLWTAFMALCFKVGAPLEIAAAVAGTASAALLLIALFRFLRRRIVSRSLALLAPLALALHGSFALWAGAGLETALFTLLLFHGVALSLRERITRRTCTAMAALFVAATLTRPEGALLFGVVLLSWLMRREMHLPERIRTALPGLALFVGSMILLEAWRLVYYGDWLPNTFHAKVGADSQTFVRGVHYLAGFLGEGAGWPFVLPAVALLFLRPDRWARRVLVFAACYMTYVLAVGGDGLPFYRFMVPLLPWIVALAAHSLDRLLQRRSPASRRLALAGGLILLVPLHASFGGSTFRFIEQDRIRVDFQWTTIGRWLAEHARPGDSVAVHVVGAIPYFAGLPTIDMLGMTDRHIARRSMPEMGRGIAGHEKHDISYVLSRRPTYLLHHPFLMSQPVMLREHFITPWNPGLRELLDNDEFHRLYRKASVKIGAYYLTYFELRDP